MTLFKTNDDFETSDKQTSRWVLGISLVVPAILGITLTCIAVLYVWLYIQQVQNRYRLSKLSEQYELLTTIQRKLRLEWSHVENPVRLEELGREQFGLAPPGPNQLLDMR
jgi:cell division protein FtsL